MNVQKIQITCHVCQIFHMTMASMRVDFFKAQMNFIL